MPNTMTFTKKVTLHDCCSCGGPIALSDEMADNLKRNGKIFWCPAGHQQHFMGETMEQMRVRFERNVAALRTKVRNGDDALDGALKDISAKKKELAAAKRRADNGVCPHCHRTFKQVTRHVRARHPGADVRTRTESGL